MNVISSKYAQKGAWYDFGCVQGVINSKYCSGGVDPEWTCKKGIRDGENVYMLAKNALVSFMVPRDNIVHYEEVASGIRHLLSCVLEDFSKCIKERQNKKAKN